jgi:hypothetical protein
MKKGQNLNYFGKSAEVVEFNNSHVLIKFKNGSKLCTLKSTFDKDYK